MQPSWTHANHERRVVEMFGCRYGSGQDYHNMGIKAGLVIMGGCVYHNGPM